MTAVGYSMVYPERALNNYLYRTIENAVAKQSNDGKVGCKTVGYITLFCILIGCIFHGIWYKSY